MSIQTVPVKYKTSDGKEFTNETQAKKHQDLITAKEKYEEARHRYGAMLAESQKTADGYPFEITLLHDYYYVTPGYFGMPELAPVSFYYWNCDLNDQDETVIVVEDRGKGSRTQYKIGNLYYRKENAYKALIEAKESKLEELTKEVREFRAKLNEE